MSVQCATTPSTRSAVYWFSGASVTGFALIGEQVAGVHPPLVGLEEEVDSALASLAAGGQVVHATEVGAVAGVDLDLGSGLEEQRDVDRRAGLERRGLGATGGAVALQAGLGVGDLEDHRRRQLDVEHGALVGGDLRGLVLQQVVGGVADGRLGDVDLVVRRAVHEHEVGAVLVEVLHVTTVDGRGLDLDSGVEGLVDDLARHHVLQLGAHEGRALAGLDVLELHDGPQLALEVEHQAVLQVVGRCHVSVAFLVVRRMPGARGRGRPRQCGLGSPSV